MSLIYDTLTKLLKLSTNGVNKDVVDIFLEITAICFEKRFKKNEGVTPPVKAMSENSTR
ncbi:hypothetical protein [Acinetobacter baumannii]|uniref:hypothetical protein n=1 Tax=Acinetobacter baumannii TaxID=470 RepID=UPI0029413E38|nr:hypothetical protein [Acinetobacter baumannii]MDV4330624.1 hypothetical protein [Acinetobacter baumannii]MDV4334197.1 hypothetical protein [Acinetobacter baumannii]HCQ9869330.1 hypothetical protein [Acinetobacter baumannii]